MKRSEIKRTKPLVRTQPQASAKVSPKRCKVCREDFFQVRPMQTVCSPKCGLDFARKIAEGQEKERRRQEVKQDRAKREAMKRLGELRAEAQRAFNAFIRERDRQAGHGCICCGAPLEWDSDLPGGKVDAGHFMSRGTAPALAFDEANVNAQRKSCNRPGGTTRDSFRAGMVSRYGAETVERLEGPQQVQQLRHDDLRQIRATYRAKLKELKGKAA